MDLMSNELEPMEVTRADVEWAYERILGRVRRTPVLTLEPDALGVPGHLVLKLELLQHTGSFKPRGAFNRIFAAEPDHAGVIAASGGNFGLGVAFAARELGLRAEIFVPEAAQPVKIATLRELGAEVHVVPGYYADALQACEDRVLETGALYLHAYDQPEVVAGMGTIGLELSNEPFPIDTVLVPVGGGGLIGGIGAWFAGDVRVIGVEPSACPTLHEALAAGALVDVEVGGIAADSLGAKSVGRIGLEVAKRFVERSILVSDPEISDAQRLLWRACRVTAEPGGAAALAALTTGAYVPAPDERVVVLISGGNAHPGSVA